MKNLFRLLCILLLSASALQAAKIQTVVNYTPSLCSEVRQIAALLNDFPNPKNWQIIVVCSRERWERYRAKFGALATDSAFTLRTNRITVVNAAMCKRKSSSESRFVLAHEAGHLICNCNDERLANQEAARLLEDSQLNLMFSPRPAGGRQFVK
jgi:Zn-dependent protease with chaperone function